MDCISKDKFIKGIAVFLDTEIIPKMSEDFLHWLAGGLSGTVLCMCLGRKYDEYAEDMRALGMLNENGIDLGFLKEFMSCAFKKHELLKLSPCVFLQEDSLLLKILPKHIDLTLKDAERLLDILKVEKEKEQ